MVSVDLPPAILTALWRLVNQRTSRFFLFCCCTAVDLGARHGQRFRECADQRKNSAADAASESGLAGVSVAVPGETDLSLRRASSSARPGMLRAQAVVSCRVLQLGAA